MENREKALISEIMKLFSANQWVITPEGIWGFIQEHREPMEFEKVLAIYREITQEDIKN